MNVQSPSSSPWAQRDLIGGFTTFVTMAYIVAVNPAILATEGTGISFSGALTATVALCFLMTLFMGLYARLPFGVAPGMGLNAFFTFTVVLGAKVPWPVALGMVFWSGLLFLLISATKLRESIALGIPLSVRNGAAAGIGLFLCFIGLKTMGVVQSDPVTFVKAGALKPETLLSLGGLVLGAFLLQRKHPLAYLATIGGVTAGAGALGLIKLPTSVLALPDFTSTVLKLDILGALKPEYLGIILAITFTDLFDSISTFVGVSEATRLVPPAEQRAKFRKGLIVDAFATLCAGLLGTSPGTAYIESAAGIQAGARTGRAAVVTALCFLPCFFLAPVIGMIPGFATAPVLVLVGLAMFGTIQKVDFSKVEIGLPTFLTMILIPLTFSITQGILWGFIFHAVLFVAAGRRRELTGLLVGLAAISVLILCIEAAL